MALKILTNQVGKLDWRKRSVHNVELERLKIDLLDVEWTPQETADHLEISFKRLKERLEKHIEELQQDKLEKYPPNTPRIPPWEQQNGEPPQPRPISVTQLTEYVAAFRGMLEQLKEFQHENVVLQCKPLLEDWEDCTRSFEEAIDVAKNRQRKRSLISLPTVEESNKEQEVSPEATKPLSLSEDEWEDDFFEKEDPVPDKVTTPKRLSSPAMRGFRFSSRVRAVEGLRKRTQTTDAEKENENLLGELETLTGKAKSAAMRIQESLKKDKKVTEHLNASAGEAVDLAHQLNRRAKELLAKASASDIGFCLALSISMGMFWVTFMIMYFI